MADSGMAQPAVTMSEAQAYVRIEHFGTREQLAKALGQLKLALREQAGQTVIVETR